MEEDSFMVDEKRKVSLSFLQKCLTDDEDVPPFTTFKSNCEGIFDAAVSFGLSEEDLILVKDVLGKLTSESEHFNFLVRCLVPQSSMPSEISTYLLKWLLKNFPKESQTVQCSTVLHWFASGLQHNIISKSYLQTHFTWLFHILKKISLSKPACYVLCLIAKTEYLMPCHINLIMAVQEKCTKVKTAPPQFSYLLSFIKTHRPELVSFKVPHASFSSAFSTALLEKFNQIFEGVRERVVDPNPSNDSAAIFSFKDDFGSDVFTDIPSSVKNLEIIPHASFIATTRTSSSGASHKEDTKIDISEVSSFEDLGKNWHNIRLPDNALSLLRSKIGLYFLVLGSKQLQHRFKFNLHATLEDRVLRKCSSEKEIDLLLKLIIRFENFIQQGLSPVSYFLRCYLIFWNGLDYKDSILKLISWITFDSYEELNRYCLKPLYFLYISSETETKCDIIHCLTDLLSNLVTFSLEKDKNNETRVFLSEDCHEDWLSDPSKVLINVIEFIQQLVTVGLLQEPCNVILINSILDFYDRVCHLEENYNLKSMTVMPESLVQQCILCSIVQPLNRAAGLLLRYRKWASTFDEDKFSTLDVQMKMIESNVQNILCLVSKKQITENGLFNSDVKNEVASFVDVDSSLQHPAILIPLMLKRGTNAARRVSGFQESLKVHCPEILQLVTICEESDL